MDTTSSVETPELRRGWSPVVVAATVGVGVASALFANAFRDAMLWLTDVLTGDRGPVAAARSLAGWKVFALSFVGLLVASALGSWARRWRGDGLGLAAVAAAAQGRDTGPSLPGTAVRTGATFIAASTLSSIGRESAIIEAGAAVGASVGRRLRRRGAQFAATGITAAFVGAYHAPLASVCYVEEHLGIRRCRRTIVHAVVGAAVGFWVTRALFDTHALLPEAQDPWSLRLVVVAALVVVPTFVASRLFVAARERLAPAVSVERSRRYRVTAAIGFAAISAAMVASVPRTAGNGLEALREAAGGATVAMAVALLAGKLIATAAALGSGAPGGVLSPSLAVAAGAALLTLQGAAEIGLNAGVPAWDIVLVVMAVGLAVSVRSPLMAVVMVPEMTGDLRLVVPSVVVVLIAVLLGRAVDRWVAARHRVVNHQLAG